MILSADEIKKIGSSGALDTESLLAGECFDAAKEGNKERKLKVW